MINTIITKHILKLQHAIYNNGDTERHTKNKRITYIMARRLPIIIFSDSLNNVGANDDNTKEATTNTKHLHKKKV